MPKSARRKTRVILRWIGRSVVGIVLIVVTSVILVSCALMPPRAGSIDGVARLGEIPGVWPALRAPVTISWDEHLIPMIEAQNDDDAAFAIGIVHAHLRLAQMEIFRKVSQGRLAEMAGPVAADIDEGIRAIDLDRAVDDMLGTLPEPTLHWMERYVEGVNAYRSRVRARPADARVLGFNYASEPWTVRDVLTFGRLASVDVNWGRWLVLAGLKDEQGYDDFTSRLWVFGDAGVPSFGSGTPHDLRVLTDIGRTGSNAIVVSGQHSASGGALVASDPHLGLPQPNIWCVLGYRTPDRTVIGLTIPCLPFVLLGRNEHVAWTGTNMQSSSTVLYTLPEGATAAPERTEHIGVRWWFDRTSSFRESAFGPVISDAKVLRSLGEGDVAMRWRGHTPSDEASAFLRASTARGWAQFREAFGSYAVAGQNMLYADADGNIGQLMAIEAVPAAADASRFGVVDAEDPRWEWTPGVPSTQLPYSFNPDSGFLVSANNVPTTLRQALVPQGNANDRVVRMSEVLSGQTEPMTLDDLTELQRDTGSIASRRVAEQIVTVLGEGDLPPEIAGLRDELNAWGGHYDAESRGAAVYQVTLSALIDELYNDRYSERIRRTLRSGPYVHAFVLDDLRETPDRAGVLRALSAAGEQLSSETTWGDLHRLRLAHPIGMIPVVGGAYVFEEHPVPGSTTTVYKTAHAVQQGEHATTFGSNARLLCDMGTLDDNRVVVLGGQDGWIGSDRLLDQVPLWRSGRTIPLPLSREAQRARAVRVMELTRD